MEALTEDSIAKLHPDRIERRRLFIRSVAFDALEAKALMESGDVAVARFISAHPIIRGHRLGQRDAGQIDIEEAGEGLEFVDVESIGKQPFLAIGCFEGAGVFLRRRVDAEQFSDPKR